MENKIRMRKRLEQRFKNDRSNSRYMVTMVCKNRKPVFGKIDDGLVIASEFTSRAADAWLRLVEYFPQIQLGEFVFMPDHFHGLVEVNFNDQSEPVSLAKVIHFYKTMSSVEYVKYGNSKGINPIGQLWQRGYNEGYLPNDHAYGRAVQYIRDNPKTYHPRSRFR